MYPFPENKKREVDDLIHCMGYCAFQMIKSKEQGDSIRAERFTRDMEMYYNEIEYIAKQEQEKVMS